MARFLNSKNQFVIPNFLGGIHEEADPSLLKSNEAAKAQNCNIDKGVLKRCDGIQKVYTTASPAAFMTYYNAGSEDLLIVADGNLLRLNNPLGTYSWELLGLGLAPNSWSNRYDFVNDNIDGKDVIVFANGIDPVQIYDGTELRAIKKLGKTSTPDATNNVIYGKYLVMHYERLWVASDNTVYASSVTRDGFDIEDFTTPTDELEVNQHGLELPMYGSDGKIIGMTVVFDDILVFKEKAIHKIFGTDPTNYSKINFSARGAISDKSIANHETGCFFADHGGIYFYDGSTATYISRAIEDTWKSINTSYLNKAVGFIYDDKYVLSVAESPSAVNNLVIEYDIKNKNFMLRRVPYIEGSIKFNRKTYVWGTGTDIFEYDKGDTYNGASINAYWESGYTDLGYPEAVKDIDTIYITASSAGSLRITVTTEKGSTVNDIMLNSTDDKVYSIRVPLRGRIFKVKIENISGTPFTLKSLKMLYEMDYD